MTNNSSKSIKLKPVFFFSIAVCLLLILAFFGFRLHSAKRLNAPNLRAQLSDLKPAYFTSTSIETFGDDGVHLFENLYAKKNKFLISQDHVQSFLPSGKYAYSIDKLQHKELCLATRKHKTKLISGTTLILASEDSMKKMQHHYFHFLEEFLLGWSAFKHKDWSDLKTIIFPDTESWQGINSINKQILTHLLPGVTILNKSDYAELSKNSLLQFEKAIFVDRMACHNLEPVRQYNKMVLGHAPLISPTYIQEFKDKVLDGLKTQDNLKRKTTITYINRKNRRHLDPEFRTTFLKHLKAEFPTCKVQDVWFEKHSYKEQLQIIRNTDILIAPHGNGLTHAFFLPKNSLVFEIFPEGSFAMDYQLISELSGHDYFAIDPKAGVISSTGHHMPPKGNVNQVIPAFDMNLITDRIRDYLNTSSTTLKDKSCSE